MLSVSEYRTVRMSTPINCQRATPSSIARYDRNARFFHWGAAAVVAEASPSPAPAGLPELS
jgi:hypothetical protein